MSKENKMRMNWMHPIITATLLASLSACVTTPQFRNVSVEEAFSDIRALEEEAKQIPQSPPEWNPLYTQAVNKSVPCKLPTSQNQLDRKNFRAYWDGECKDGFAYGLGRDIAISDTHHLEEIALYGGTAERRPNPAVTYDFVHQTVNYSMTKDKARYLFREIMTNEGANFHIEYRQTEHLENGDIYVISWSPFNPAITRAGIIENVVYRYVTYENQPLNNATPILHFQTLGASGPPIGFELAKYANGQVRHAKVDNGELVELPKEYLSMIKQKYREFVKFNSRVSNRLNAAKRMEKEYLHLGSGPINIFPGAIG
jgi:hypothetical protein